MSVIVLPNNGFPLLIRRSITYFLCFTWIFPLAAVAEADGKRAVQIYLDEAKRYNDDLGCTPNPAFPDSAAGTALRVLHRHLCINAEADNIAYENALTKTKFETLEVDQSILTSRERLAEEITMRESAMIITHAAYKNIETRYQKLLEELRSTQLGAGGGKLVEEIGESMRRSSGAYGKERFTSLSIMRALSAQTKLLTALRDNFGKYSLNDEGELNFAVEVASTEKEKISTHWKDWKKRERELDRIALAADRFTTPGSVGTEAWIRKVAADLER